MSQVKRCSECSAEFECGANESPQHCWCGALPKVMPFPPSSDCLCPTCLTTKIEVIEAYNAISKAYAEKFANEILLKPKVQEFIKDFLKEIPEPEIICDIGCGPGQVARYLKNQLKRNAAGIDLSPKMIEEANAINPDISFKAADVLQMTEQNLYGGIIALYFIVNFEPAKLPLVFTRLLHLLKPGGRLLLSFHIGKDELKRIDSLWDSEKAISFYFFQPETVSTALARVGFKVDEIRFRDSDIAIEYDSKRAYIFASKSR